LRKALIEGIDLFEMASLLLHGALLPV